MTESWEGKLKETEGKLTDDEVRERQGQGEQKWDEVKEGAEDLGTEAERRWDDAKDEVDDRI